MSRQTFAINFYCRSSKADSRGLARIEMSIIVNGKRTYWALDRRERPEDFSSALSSRRDNELKRYCEEHRLLAYGIKKDMMEAHIPLTAVNFKECIMNGGVQKEYTIGQMWNDLLSNKHREVDTGRIKNDSFNRYFLARDAFYDATGFGPETPVQFIELQHIYDYQNYLEEEKKLQQSTIYRYQHFCSLAMRVAQAKGMISTNPYLMFKNPKPQEKEIVWLDEDELKRMAQTDCGCDRLNRVRDLFLFQCYCGLAYSDLAGLTREDFQENDLGQIFIEKRRVKTNARFMSVVLKEGREILERYHYELPMLSNSNYNVYLKEIQDIVGIRKTLHTHMARTTYICYLYEHKIDRSRIATLVGHEKCETTLRFYAKLDKKAVFRELRECSVAENIERPKIADWPKADILRISKTEGKHGK